MHSLGSGDKRILRNAGHPVGADRAKRLGPFDVEIDWSLLCVAGEIYSPPKRLPHAHQVIFLDPQSIDIRKETLQHLSNLLKPREILRII